MKLLSVLMVMAMVLSSPEVFAKRLGGGSSFGKQSGNVTQRNAAPPANAPANSATPAPSNAASAAKAPAPPAAAVPAKKPWGAMLGGLAAGLGLAWLASSLGFGEAFGQVLMFLLLGVAVLAVVGFLLRARRGATTQPGTLAYQGAGGAELPRSYSPNNVGNDASARPWERSTTGFEASRFGEAPKAAAGGSIIGSALAGSPQWGVPAGFDVDGFLAASKTNFIGLQAAWDRSDIPTLRAMMTDDMLAQITAQLAERERQAPGAVNATDVVMLEAHLLGIEEAPDEYMASVEFSGMLREDASAGPSPFREVWNITRPKSGPGGWLVAGVQALQ